MIVNHKNNSTIWYHTTQKERVKNILKNGLKPNSIPTWQSSKEPWIYLSTEPWNKTADTIILEVNLKDIDTKNVGWAFADDDTPKEQLWQLRCFVPIKAKNIKIHNKEVIK